MRLSLQVVLVATIFLWATATLCAQTISEQYLFSAANQDRAAHGLNGLRIDDHLVVAARIHAYAMAEHRTISHQFQGEHELAQRAGDSGARFSLITENVAEASNSKQIHEMWMRSAGHRANLLDPMVDAVGISVVQKDGQLYAVEDFARNVTQLSIAQQEAKVSDLLSAAGLAVGGHPADARQTCTMSTGFVGRRQPWFVMRYTASSLNKLPQQLSSEMATGKYREADVGACVTDNQTPFTSYRFAVMLYP